MADVKKNVRAMTDERKASIVEGRKLAKEQREVAEQLFERAGGMLISWKFWRKVDPSTRNEIMKAIKKADKALLDVEIRQLETQLAAKRAEKDAVDA